MNAPLCSVDGCKADVHAKGYCYAHYMKAWRYGTPTPQHPSRIVDLTGSTFGLLTVVERQGKKWLCHCDCGATTLVRPGDLNRGTASSCGSTRLHRRQDSAGYRAAHDRVYRDRGRAADHQCVDCGQPAHHWSYNHDDPDERTSRSLPTNGIAFSLKPDHYSPRCVPCHKTFDLNAIKGDRGGSEQLALIG